MEKEQIKVSIVIPAYNAEKYMEECIASLQAQTLREFEIICVDDGSTDHTLEILERIQKQDGRIKIYHQKNQYAGMARNLGMSYATGKYLLFLDSDDFFEKTLLEKVYLEAERCEAQVVLFGADIFDDEAQEITPMPWSFKRKFVPDTVPFSAKQAEGLFRATTSVPWTKLFLREYINQNGIKFQSLQNANDVLFVFTAMAVADRISYVDEVFVHYRKGLSENIQSEKYKYPLAFLEAYSASFHELQKRGIYPYVKKGFHEAVIWGCMANYHTSKNPKVRNRLKEAFLSDKFAEMDLFAEESEKGHSIHFYHMQSLLKGIRSESFLTSVQKKALEAVLWKEGSEGRYLQETEEAIQSWLNGSPDEGKGFAEAYAWLCAYLNLCKCADCMEQEGSRSIPGKKALNAVLQEAADRYRMLPENEKYMFFVLDDRSQSLFEALVVYSKTELAERKKQTAEIRKKCKNLREQANTAAKKQKAAEQQLARIQSSKAYKLGKALMWLPWKIRKLFSGKR